MKVFIIGFSGIGKSPFSKLLKGNRNLQIISASEWVRCKFPIGTPTDVLTSYSKENLLKEPNSCVNFIYQKYSFDNRVTIIEGIRNPYDFNRLFDYTTDIVVFLTRNGLSARTTFEENGIAAIKSYTDFLLSEGLLNQNKVLNVFFNTRNKYSTSDNVFPTKNSLCINDLEDAIDPLNELINK